MVARHLDERGRDQELVVPENSAAVVTLDGEEIPNLSPVCGYCRHWLAGQGRTCAAFTERDSIPNAIWLGRHDHQTPYPGDHGILFELHPDATPKAVAEFERLRLHRHAEQFAVGDDPARESAPK